MRLTIGDHKPIRRGARLPTAPHLGTPFYPCPFPARFFVCLLGQDSTRSVVSESGSVPESSVDPLEFGVSDFEELMSEGRCQSIDTQIPTYQTLINHP